MFVLFEIIYQIGFLSQFYPHLASLSFIFGPYSFNKLEKINKTLISYFLAYFYGIAKH
jgi:hypothetical protein